VNPGKLAISPPVPFLSAGQCVEAGITTPVISPLATRPQDVIATSQARAPGR
jgi:hypothetical protein